MPCPEAAKLEQDVWALMQAIAQRDATIDRLKAVAAAADALADSIDELLSGGIEMKPVGGGPVTFEAMVMNLQMIRAHRDAYRAAAGEGES